MLHQRNRDIAFFVEPLVYSTFKVEIHEFCLLILICRFLLKSVQAIYFRRATEEAVMLLFS